MCALVVLPELEVVFALFEHDYLVALLLAVEGLLL